MAEKSNVFEENVRHVGFFNFKELYAFCYDWLKDQGYFVSEDSYVEKLTDRGKDLEIKWTAKKKVSDYFRNTIEVKWIIIGLNDAEGERDGKKEKTNKGDVKITISADLERDYEEKWEVNPVYKFFRGIYDKYIIRTTLEEYEDRLTDKADSFREQIKAFLTLEGKK